MNDFGFYFSIGWHHIMTLEALDHLLFIAALAAIYLLRDWKQVLILVTAFTVGHTLTLFLSAKELVSIDIGLVEFLVPCTIAVTAITNLFQKNFTPRAIRINYLLALIFGLIHGLAFAETLRMILAKDQSFALALVSFSLGLETGQILVVLLILVLAQLVTSLFRVERRHWVIFLSAAVFGLSLQMALERLPGSETGHTALQAATGKDKGIFFDTGCTAPMDRQWRRSVQQRYPGEAIRLASKQKFQMNTNNV